MGYPYQAKEKRLFDSLSIGDKVSGYKDGVKYSGTLMKMEDERLSGGRGASGYKYEVKLDYPISLYGVERTRVSISRSTKDETEETISNPSKRKKNVLGVASTIMGEALESTYWAKGSKFVKEGLRGKKKRKNPGIEDAEDLTEKWHGRKPRTEQEIIEIETYTEDLAELAELEELGILGSDMSQYFISFKTNRPAMCAEDVNNIMFVGGDQSINVEDVGLEKDGKRWVPIGLCYQIVYESDKFHLEGSSGKMESYEHFFGEEFYKESVEQDDFKTSDDFFTHCLESGLVQEAIELGLIPMLVYNKTDEKLLLVGGQYEVTELGIKN